MQAYYALYSFGPYEGDLYFTFYTEKSDLEFRPRILDEFKDMLQKKIENFNVCFPGDEDNESIYEFNKCEMTSKINFIEQYTAEFLEKGLVHDAISYRSITYRKIELIEF